MTPLVAVPWWEDEHPKAKKKKEGPEAHICYRVEVIGQPEGHLVPIEINNNGQGICNMNSFNDNKRIPMTHVPPTDSNSSSRRPKNSIANREASGEEALCVGGVGNDADGANGDTRASKDNECGPSTIR
jgi:hypothetical protein